MHTDDEMQLDEEDGTREHGVVRTEGCEEYGCSLSDVSAPVSAGPFYDEGYRAGLAEAAAQISALANRLDMYAEWNLLSRRKREERWPEEHSHMVSRPQASVRARTMIRDLALRLPPGKD